MGSFYRSQHELIFVFRNGKASHRNNVQLGKFGRNRTNVWQYPGVNTLSRQGQEGNLLALHPTVKPVTLVADALLDCTAPGELVLDSFLGSGSTLIAAERTGRVCRGIELDPLYVDTVIRRWQRYTGGNAIHAELAGSLVRRRWPVADEPYEVGFGRPPKHTQFKKGRSGNPKGRPKGSKNVHALIRKILDTKVIAKGPEGSRFMTMQEAAIRQLFNKAANGDLKAIQHVIQLTKEVQEKEPYLNSPTFVVNFVKSPNDDSPDGVEPSED
jgi:hypothetical protein